MSRLSVNINKIATLRNARGGEMPNLVKVAQDCERFGADGITIHPRPDERHIRYQDVFDLKKIVTTEFNLEGYPNEKFISLVNEVMPEQVTLVPDPPGVLTSSAGWDLHKNLDFLKEVISQFKEKGIRVSIFMEADLNQLKLLTEVGTDRVELYTGPYADSYKSDKNSAVKAYTEASKLIMEKGLGLNAGHDLNLENLAYFKEKVYDLKEVSIGHALISDALYYGLENTIQMYQRELK